MNKEKKAQYNKEYREKNLKSLKRWYKKYYQKNSEKKIAQVSKYRKDNSGYIKEYAQSAHRRFLNGASKAKARKLTWMLSEVEYREFLVLPCDYCGVAPKTTVGVGLDRLDNRLGYFLENVVSCCANCNRKKGRIEGVGFSYPRTVELMRELMRELMPSSDAT